MAFDWVCLNETAPEHTSSLLSMLSTLSTSAKLDPNSRAFAYGDGFFTTIGVMHGKLLWQPYHAKRLTHHAHALHITLTDGQDATLWQHAQTLAQQIEHGIIKVIVTRPIQAVRGYGFSTEPTDNKAQIWLGSKPTDPLVDLDDFSLNNSCNNLYNNAKLADYLGINTDNNPLPLMQPAITAVCLDARLSSHSPPLAGLKTLNRLDNVLASGELNAKRHAQPEQHFSEGLVRDLAGNWVEGTMSNVFYRLQDDLGEGLSNMWYTPPIVSAGVAGVMRSVLMNTCKQAKLPCVERPLTDADLPNLQALFFCNAVRGVVPVKTLTFSDENIGFDVV